MTRSPFTSRSPRVPGPVRLRYPLAVGAAALALAALATPAAAQAPAGGAPAAGGPPAAAPAPRRKRQPPPAVMPIAETAAANKSYSAGNYEQAVSQAKTALTKNDKYTPAMLIMAKAYYKLRKYEWVRHLDKMMQANNATEAERAEMYHLLAWMEIEKKNTPGSIDFLKKSTDLRAENPVTWNNLGAQYLEAKNYKDAAPVLEKAVQLNPTFAKAYLNLGSAYRGLKEYDRAQTSYQKALQLFPNYADAVFHMGLLYLDAEKIQNMDTIAKLNTAVGHFQKYKQMMGSLLRPADPVDSYIAEAQDKIGKEQRRIERQKKQEERDKQRQSQKAAPAADKGGAEAGKAAEPAAKKPEDAPPPPAN
jgi:tetratricopeptide (TPR) repeat protein